MYVSTAFRVWTMLCGFRITVGPQIVCIFVQKYLLVIQNHAIQAQQIDFLGTIKSTALFESTLFEDLL